MDTYRPMKGCAECVKVFSRGDRKYNKKYRRSKMYSEKCTAEVDNKRLEKVGTLKNIS